MKKSCDLRRVTFVLLALCKPSLLAVANEDRTFEIIDLRHAAVTEYLNVLFGYGRVTARSIDDRSDRAVRHAHRDNDAIVQAASRSSLRHSLRGDSPR